MSLFSRLPFRVGRSTSDRFMYANSIETQIHEIHKSDAEWREEIEQFAYEIAAQPEYRKSAQELTQIELFGENLLNIFVAFD